MCFGFTRVWRARKQSKAQRVFAETESSDPSAEELHDGANPTREHTETPNAGGEPVMFPCVRRMVLSYEAINGENHKPRSKNLMANEVFREDRDSSFRPIEEVEKRKLRWKAVVEMNYNETLRVLQIGSR